MKFIFLLLLANVAHASYVPQAYITDPVTGVQQSVNASNESLTHSSQSGSWSTGRTWSLLNTTDSISSVQSGAWTTGRTWTLLSSTDSVNVGNFPATFGVTQSTSPWVTSRNWNLVFASDKADVSGSSVSVSNFPATQPISGSVSVSNFPATQPVSGTVTANIGTTNGLALDSSITSLSAKFNSLGQKTSANSAPVVIASDQSAIPVSQSGTWSAGRTWTLLNSTDSVNAVQSGTWNINNISGTVSLPTGAATSAKQPALGTAGSASVDVITVQGIASMTPLKVDGSAVTQPVSGTVTANIGTSGSLALDASVTGLQVSQGSTTSGQKGGLTMGAVTTNMPSYSNAQTSPLSLNLRGALRSKNTGGDTAQLVRNDYSSVNVTTAAYVQLVASTSVEINFLHIFDSSGQDFVLATGGAGAEVDQIQIPPGGWDAPVPLYIASGTRLSIKSKSATASSGILLITGIK